ncbi:M23 family metallopeptidase [Gardnerella vaginalis]|nr:M23 family metallopeptidase [Gardnerella vaginalis]
MFLRKVSRNFSKMFSRKVSRMVSRNFSLRDSLCNLFSFNLLFKKSDSLNNSEKSDKTSKSSYILYFAIVLTLVIVAIGNLISSNLISSNLISNNYNYYSSYDSNKKILNSSKSDCYRVMLVSDSKASSKSICEASMLWPVKHVRILRPFDPPEKPWMAGHRGVDLEAKEGTKLFAPANGIISFAGVVAHKNVVSIKHGSITSTFEPAKTFLSVGESVKRGQLIGSVSRGSDHCDNSCVQWGLKKDKRHYEDPAIKASMRRIVWKPIK